MMVEFLMAQFMDQPFTSLLCVWAQKLGKAPPVSGAGQWSGKKGDSKIIRRCKYKTYEITLTRVRMDGGNR